MIRSSEDILAMSKIVDKYAISDIKSDLTKFIYFSECNSSHGPRIKFYGGTAETFSTKDCPALAFNAKGECQLELADWMNKKNCPNAFDNDCLLKLEHFIRTYYPILLLVWFKHLDEADALAFFHGQITFDALIENIDYAVSNQISNLSELDKYCIDNDLYSF